MDSEIRRLLREAKDSPEVRPKLVAALKRAGISPEMVCPDCFVLREDKACFHRCGMVYGRRGWRRLGDYDG